MIPKYDFMRPAKILRGKLELQSSQSKNKKIIVKNLSQRNFFQEQVKFLKSGIWFQFYYASNKDTFFTHPVSKA